MGDNTKSSLKLCVLAHNMKAYWYIYYAAVVLNVWVVLPFSFYRCTVQLDITEVFLSPTDALLLILENSKIYIKTDIKIATTCFGLRPSSGSLHLILAKVTLVFEQSVKYDSPYKR
jgi:hypothetical protein